MRQRSGAVHCQAARSVADARDLAHEAYVRLLRVKRKDLIRDPQAYLYRIAVNILYEFELKKKADAIGLARCAECLAAEADFGHPEQDVEALQARKRIEAVLGSSHRGARRSSSCIGAMACPTRRSAPGSGSPPTW